MKDKKVFEEKLEIFKVELNILNSLIIHISSNVWKIRQIGLTLWLAGLSVGLGAISQGNRPNFNILILSSIIPLLFLIIDAKETRWYFRYESRVSEIRRFLNQKDYILPSTEKIISFEHCISDQVFRFPVFDLTGSETSGNDELYLWLTSVSRCFMTANLLIYYGLQISTSVLFTSLELHKRGGILSWWIPPLIVLLLIGSLYTMAKLKTTKLKKKRNKSINRILNETRRD